MFDSTGEAKTLYSMLKPDVDGVLFISRMSAALDRAYAAGVIDGIGRGTESLTRTLIAAAKVAEKLS